MIVDSHVHVWRLDRSPYPWLTDGPLRRDVELDELGSTLTARGVDGVVLVQSDDAPGDTARMLEVADADPRVRGVVAWSPIEQPARLADDLARFCADPRVVGIRNLVHERAPGWLEQPAFDEGLGMLAEAGLPWDLPTADPAALASVPAIARRHPRLRIVIDHLGKPPVGGTEGDRQRWRELFAGCAAHPGVVAKLSGLYGATGALDAWTPGSIRPFVADAIAWLGPDRLLYGGDWPIVELAGGYARVSDALRALVDELAPDGVDEIFGGAAARVYRLPQAAGRGEELS